MADESELMARYCDGDASAFRELYAKVAPRLTSYLRKMSRDRATADDLLQLTLLKVHRHRSAYVRGADPVPWMFAIAHRTFLDEMRRRQRSRVRVADDDREVTEAAAIDGRPVTADRDQGADPERVKAALDALGQLPPSQREALILTKLDGKSIAEAAAITGATPGAIKLRAHRAYVTLRKVLGRAEEAS